MLLFHINSLKIILADDVRRIQTFNNLRHTPTCPRVNPIGSQFRQGQNNKRTLIKSGMRDTQIPFNNLATDINYIYIQQPVNIVPATITMGAATRRQLYLMKFGIKFSSIQITEKYRPYIIKGVTRCVTPCFCFIYF